MNKISKSNNKGFTIVELGVVISIIGLLATFVVVSYIGNSQKLSIATLQSDLSNAAAQLENDRNWNGSYPADINQANGGLGLPASDDTQYGYYQTGTSYCLYATSITSGISYRISSETNIIEEGICVPPTIASAALAWGSTRNDYGYSINSTSDGGYVTAGPTHINNLSWPDIYLTKYSNDGSVSWSKLWNNGSVAPQPTHVVQTSDGGYVVSGTVGTSGNYDYVLIKYSQNGTVEWSKSLGGVGEDYCGTVIQTDDGGYAVTGTYRNGSNNDASISKFTSDGTLSWTTSWGGTNAQYGADIVQSSDGGYAITGFAAGFGAGSYDMYIAKFSSTGVLSWSKTWGGTNTEYGQSIVTTIDGGYAVLGHTSGFGSGGSDMILVKYTSDGTLEWDTTIGGTGNEYAYYDQLVQDGDGNYAVSGFTDSYGAGGNDMLLVKLSSNGTVLWSKTFGTAGNDPAYGLALAYDGGYAVAGTSDSLGAGLFDAIFVKYTSDGLVNGCSSPMCQNVSVATTNPSATVSSPSVGTSSPTLTVANPTNNESTPASISTTIIAPVQ